MDNKNTYSSYFIVYIILNKYPLSDSDNNNLSFLDFINKFKIVEDDSGWVILNSTE